MQLALKLEDAFSELPRMIEYSKGTLHIFLMFNGLIRYADIHKPMIIKSNTTVLIF